jgi:hypothetical protein
MQVIVCLWEVKPALLNFKDRVVPKVAENTGVTGKQRLHHSQNGAQKNIAMNQVRVFEVERIGYEANMKKNKDLPTEQIC